MVSLEMAKNLICGQILFCLKFKDHLGIPIPCLVNGKVKTWKRNPRKVKVPIQHGSAGVDHLTENDLHIVFLSREEALANTR